ncbi:MAG: hypothetical protein HFI07_11260 [Lachnospiraceae bacterium]|nr:hypothetical protein [Lachnospiraceae bacterium]
MAAKLKEYFPMIREREELLAEIAKNGTLREVFAGWEKEQQEEFLDICTGVRGLKFLYDGFFKEILNPEYVPERFNDFLSCLLGERVKVLKVLPGDSTRIADETSLLITDIVVELEDGSIANVEMQKIGYLFPGQRCACYSADLLLRQYKRVRGEKKKKFSYRDIKNVYTVVLFERSPKEFHKYPEKYCHFFEQTSDTGLKLELLQKYVLIPLDIFVKYQHNRNVIERRDAWLTLLVCDEPEKIIELIEKYPEFRQIYEEGYEICRNTERVMEMFSKELYELDRNTVQYMMDEQQERIDAQQEEIDAQQEEINAQRETIETQQETIESQKEMIAGMQEEAIKGTVHILRNVNIPEQEIITQICNQYRIREEEAKRYLQ